MSLKKQTKVIDGIEVTCQQFECTRSIILSAKLGRMLASAASKVDKIDLDMDIAALAPALQELLTCMDPEELPGFCIEVLGSTAFTMNNTVVTVTDSTSLDVVFRGRFPALFKALLFALEVNYADFFGGNALSKLQSLVAAQGLKSQSTSENSGLSGASG